jgi:rubrerythrin
MSKEELVIALRKQRDLESKAVESLSFLAESSKNDVVKLLLLGIMQDSKKHARLVEALIHITEARGVGYVEDEELINGVDEYMKIEEEMAKTVDEIMKMTDRKEVKSILGQVALEEQRHHQTLLELREVIAHITGVTEDALWNYLNKWANFST